ncbi:MAG: MFS transporter [Bacteroidetes bacterium]|nr:MFS transporter [Bacteroidota bacterium]
MQHFRIKLSLFLNYFVFAILLNSVGTVILQVQNNFGVSKGAASVLEGFKDLPIAITSFLVASYVIRIGYKRSMLIALGLVTVMCLLIPSVPSFLMTKLLFASVGISFALIKVSVFATLGLITKDKKEHLSLMSFLESFFMVGVLTGYFVFASVVDNDDSKSTGWFNVYYMLAGLSALALILLATTKLDESSVQKEEKGKTLDQDFVEMIKLIILPLVLVFIFSAFFYVLIEQSIMSWLPTFNKDVLHLSTSMSIKMASILSAAIAAGRLLAGIILKKIDWLAVLVCCLICAATVVLITVPLTKSIPGTSITKLADVPLAGFAFPLIGLFLAPVYPAINSIILGNLPVHKHAAMSGLIVVFSALGGTTGSMITGHIFGAYGGQTAFYSSLAPVTILIILLFIFRKMQPSQNREKTIQ